MRSALLPAAAVGVELGGSWRPELAFPEPAAQPGQGGSALGELAPLFPKR